MIGRRPPITAGIGVSKCRLLVSLFLPLFMVPSPVRKCPLCGSEKIKLLEPDPFQIRAGQSLVVKCECGALVTMTILKPEQPLPIPRRLGHEP